MKKLSLNPEALVVDTFSLDKVQDGAKAPTTVADTDMPETPYC